MRVLLTGASGFVGSALAPKLLAEGYQVRALARDPARARSALVGASEEVEVVRGDVLSGEGLSRALRGIEVAYYLIHSMESQPAGRDGRAGGLGGSDKKFCAGHERTGALSLAEREPLGELSVTERERTGALSVAEREPLGELSVTDRERTGALSVAERERLGEHSVTERERTGALSFAERERLGATMFAAEARGAGVARIVYLGGLLPRVDGQEPSRHLASRAEVQKILFEHVPDSVALRSAIVIGARSRSFRMMVRLVERLRVLVLPPWRRFRTQPIDARDMVEMLLAAAVLPEVGGRALDIGGPEALTYEAMLERIAELLILPRPTLGVRVGMTPITARLAAAFASEDPELVLPLMEGLEGDLLPRDNRAAELLGVELHSFDDAVECALREWEAVQPLAAR
jgi:uncharacterized protein YbjT (DUF2867 family)